MDDSTTPEPTAENDILAAFRADPSNANLFADLHKALKKGGLPHELAELLELRAAHDSDRLLAAKLLSDAAEARMAAGDLVAAERDYRASLDKDPAQPRATSGYCELLIGRKRFAEAAAIIESELAELERRAAEHGKEDSKNAFAARRADRHSVLAEIWDRHLGRVDRALHNWQRAWQLESSRTDALEAARGIYSSLGEDAMVARLYQSELDSLGNKGNVKRRALLHKSMGQLRVKLREFDAAASCFERALELEPGAPHTRELLADLYAMPAFADDASKRARAAELFVELSQLRLKEGDADGAIGLLRRALGTDPESRTAAHDLEKVLRAAERWRELDRFYDHMAELVEDEKELAELLRRRCNLYQKLEDRDGLKDALGELARIEGPSSEASAELRKLYREDEDWSELADLIERDAAAHEEGSTDYARVMLELATIEREHLRQRDRAAEHIHRVLQHNPRQEEALARYADHFRERRDWRGLADLGEFALEKLQESGASTGEVLRRLEELALLYEQRLGDLERALGCWRRVAELDPNSAKASEATRRLSSRAKTWQSLIGVLEKEAEAAVLPEQRAEVLRRIAQTYRERHFNPRRAIALYEEVLSTFPDDEASLKAVGDLYDREGDEAGLAHSLRRRLELDARLLDRELAASGSGRAPTSREWPVSKRVERLNLLRRLATKYEDSLADVDGVVFACSGILEILPGDRDALGRMERVLEKSGDTARLEQTLQYHAASATGPAEKAKVLRRLAALAAKREDKLAAMERWEQVLQAAPNDNEALDALAALYEEHKRWGELASVLERRVSLPAPLDPGSDEAARRVGKLRRYATVVDKELGDSARAVKAWRKLVDAVPNDREGLESLARLYESAGQWRELVQLLEQLVPLYLESDLGKAAETTLKRASLLEERLGAPADAASALEHLIAEIDPTNLAGHKALRRLYEARGEFDSAVRIAEREIYLADEPKQKVARGLEIGFLCRDRLSDPTRALQAFERVLELEPEHPEATTAAGDLYAVVGNWTRHIELLEQQLEGKKAGRERRALMLRIAKTIAERRNQPKEAFLWYRRAHNHAPDPTTLAELRRAAEAYALWEELIEVYDDEREGLKDEAGLIKDKPAYVEFCREIATVAERRLEDHGRAVQALRDALTVQPRSEALLSEVERIAQQAESKELWQAYLGCVELTMTGMSRSAKVATFAERARILEERLGDTQTARQELLKAYSWQPDRDEVIQAIYGLAERSDNWDDVIAVEASRFERAMTRDARIAALRQKGNVIETKLGDRVRAFRVHLSAFLLAPEEPETLATLWRLAREIGEYDDSDAIPKVEPPAARVEAPEPTPSLPKRRPARASKPPADRTMELSIGDLLLAREGLPSPAAGADADEDTVDEPVDDEFDTSEDASLANLSVGDSTQPLDLKDLMLSEEAKPHAKDPTMQLRTEDLIEALRGSRGPSASRPPAHSRVRRPSQAPPPPPPARPTIRRMGPGGSLTPIARKPIPAPTMPHRKYSSPWDELSSAYELLPTPSPAMKLRWLFRSAEVQETGAGNIKGAFDILAKALDVAPDPQEARGRLARLADEHGAWDRLGDLYQKAADEARSSEDAASYLMEVAEVRVRQGRPLETESIYRRILGMRPDDDVARAKLEELYRQEDRWVDLAASLEERTDPRLGSAAPETERPRLLRELAAVYQEQLDRPHDAIDALERLRKLVPEDVSVLSTMADLHSQLGRWSKVIDSLTKIADVAEATPSAHDALRRIASIYEDQLELADRAIDAYVSITSYWPDDLEAHKALDRLYETHARWDELSDTLRKRAGLARDPDERALLLGRRAGVLLQWLDAPDEAAAALRHARTIKPEDDSLADQLVVALTRAGREREAAAVLEGRIAAHKDSGLTNPGTTAALLIRLGTLRHEAIGDPKGAREALDEALELVPDHPTALAAKSRLAREAQDPQVYAEALLKQAEVEEDGDARIQALMKAGRVLSDECRNVEGAREAFEKVLALRPHHADATWALAGLVEQVGDLDSAAALLTKRLEEQELSALERAQISTQLAALARQAGVEAVAEHRLDEALKTLPDHTPAIIAKADLLFELERDEQLETFLNEVLPQLDEANPELRAALRRRLAAVFERQQRSDEAYQVLLEADRLHRGDVLIKLGLGENRYRARRWREAALHLGALAEHPQAEQYPAEVAEGLYHAALAEIRSLRPEKAITLYERAIELKPNYAPALHALAELAMERGDSKRAADLLTRQASATEDPDERLRMFEALGDMAMLTLGDDARARTCYQAAVGAADPLEAAHVPLLKKLLELQDLGGDAAGTARTAELLASFAEKEHERAARLTLAAESYRTAGDMARARSASKRAVTAAPYDLDAANVASEIAFEDGEFDDAAALLSRALGGQKGHDELTGPRQAQLWNRLGEARRERGDRRGAIKAFESAISIAPDSDGAMRARRHLLEVWNVDETQSRLIDYRRTLAADSRALKDIVEYARSLSGAKQFDGGRVLLEVARCLGQELAEEDLVFLREQPVRVMAADEAYSGSLDNELYRRLVGDPDFELMSRVLATLWGSASLLFSDIESTLVRNGFADAERVGSSAKLPAAAIFTRIANALGVPAVMMYESRHEDAADVTVLCSSPPVVVLGPRLCTTGDEAVPDAEMRFILGRAVELARPESIIAAGQSFEEFAQLVESLKGAFGDSPETEAAKKLRTTLPIRARTPLAKLVGQATGADLDAESYLEAVQRGADRAGFIVSGDAPTCFRLTAARTPAGETRHLVEMALQPEFLDARTLLGIGVLR